MKIERDFQFEQWMLDRIAEREFSERKGVHSSDLIYCLNKQALRKLAPIPPTKHELLLYSLGWASQRWLSGKDKDEPEIEVDGITVTPDAREGKNYWELKCTFQSSERPVTDSIHWLRQLMSQCYVTKTTSIKLSRLELMGNWKSPFGKKEEKGKPENQKPDLHAYAITFDQSELDDHWAWMRQRKLQFEEILKTGELLPKAMALASGMDFECGYCPYKERCEC